ncbi:MAG: hypothetical protein EXR82_07675 [Gammaproteobacteria bacterium]|nr:hypothetical protein [Gammaproteobacteria bacterium]
MQRNWPHTQVCREIQEFNRAFLDLVAADQGPGALFGLDAPVRQRLRLLSPPQLQAIAATPCLLAAFAPLTSGPTPRVVADAPLPALTPAPTDAARLFAAALLVWLWHTAHRDRLLTALCLGPGQQGMESLSGPGFLELQRTAAGAAGRLEARFCRHPRIWPDLVRAAGDADGEVLTATRLSMVQLTLISRR